MTAVWAELLLGGLVLAWSVPAALVGSAVAALCSALVPLTISRTAEAAVR